jgi:hypothetical protein
MQRPTGQPGAIGICIFRCIDIECRIQDVANVAILGVDSAESSHSCNNSNRFLSNVVVDGAGDNGGPNCDGGGGPPVAGVHFNNGEYQGGDEENEEVATATDANANVGVL